ncbi:hypothetical protein ACFYT3_29335 [Nocardia amikacinitolerans]|uniref:hypothetical protein n=1 Tax=Nocardia amikacinitolerans TaxID=756689 RepID=UPI0036C630C5
MTHLHRARNMFPTKTIRIDARRAEVRVLIDNWVIVHVRPRHPQSPTAGYGQVVDDMAGAYVAAELVLAADHTAAELHASWSRVGYLATHWSDLVHLAVDGQPPTARHERGQLVALMGRPPSQRPGAHAVVDLGRALTDIDSCPDPGRSLLGVVAGAKAEVANKRLLLGCAVPSRLNHTAGW